MIIITYNSLTNILIFQPLLAHLLYQRMIFIKNDLYILDLHIELHNNQYLTDRIYIFYKDLLETRRTRGSF